MLRSPRLLSGAIPLSDFDTLVATFLAREKVLVRRPRWRAPQRADYTMIRPEVAVPGERFAGRLVVTAHLLRRPEKYGFALLLRGERVLALDVNPGRIHRNFLTQQSVAVTHWQVWPHMEAEPDDREMPFGRWFDEFMRRANIRCKFRVLSPPFGIQLELPK